MFSLSESFWVKKTQQTFRRGTFKNQINKGRKENATKLEDRPNSNCTHEI